MRSNHFDIVILGAGIGGLAGAFYSKRAGLNITLLEETDRPGGVIKSTWRDGYLLEFGPNTVLPNLELMDLIKELKLSNEVLLADEKSPHYIQLKKTLHQIPMSPSALLHTKLLSFLGKLRLLMEPFVPSTAKDTDESIFSFFQRRIGKEATENFVTPFVAGVWAGDPQKLSMKATFGTLFDWEKEHGCLFKGMIKSRKDKKPFESSVPKGLLNFKNGLETLAKELGIFLKDEIKYEITISEIIPPLSPNQFPRWKLRTSAGELTSDFLIFTLPAPSVAKLIKPFASGTAWTLSDIPYVPLAVVHLAIPKNLLKIKLNGFGYLTAPSENSGVLGCLWSSGLFSNRAPEGKELLTVLAGGAKKSEDVFLNDSLLINKVFGSLYPILKFKEFPEVLSIFRYEAAIPQYTLGHPNRIQVFQNAEKTFPGLRFAGNYTGGVGVGNVIQISKKAVQEILEEKRNFPQTVREKTIFSPGLGR